MYALSGTSIERLQGVDVRIVSIVNHALKISCIDFGIAEYGGLRSTEVQNYLFQNGASQCDGIHKKSKHQYGTAVDIFAYVDGQASWQIPHLAMVAAAFLQAACILNYALQWGGHFRPLQSQPFLHGWDCGHFELIGA